MVVQKIHSEAEFDSLINIKGVAVVDAKALWCPACSMIAPRIEKLSEEYDSVIFGMFDVDECQALAEKLDITAMPTFLFLKDGKLDSKIKGADYNGIVKKLKSLTA